MTIDTCEIKDNKQGLQPLFYFRQTGRLSRLPQMDIRKRQLVLTRDMSTRDKTKKIAADSVIEFDQHGTDVTEAECLSILNKFIWVEGEYYNKAQWETNLGRKVNDGIWQAATKVWGLPRLKTTPVVHYITYGENW
ncbi:MAG: hypothetical protein Q9171_004662 [Xanthocarpia ochracea]